MKSIFAASFLLATIAVVASAEEKGGAKYDPLVISTTKLAEPLDLTVQDTARNREIPLRVYLPEKQEAAPVVLFSHGLGGSRAGSAFLGKHWAARGYVAVFLQHPGSDLNVWKDVPLARRMAALREAANTQNFLLRVKDVPAVLDQLAGWNKEDSHALHGRMDLTHVGMSGHSFGAMTTQAVSGQSLPLGGALLTDPRIKAAVIMSPSTPRRGDAKQAFGKVKVPWLLMTGTLDASPIGDQTAESRQAVFPALSAGEKYQLILDKAEHSVFTESALPGEKEPRNPKHHPAILAISTAFWDAYLRDDAAAKAWLAGDGSRSVLEKADQWELK